NVAKANKRLPVITPGAQHEPRPQRPSPGPRSARAGNAAGPREPQEPGKREPGRGAGRDLPRQRPHIALRAGQSPRLRMATPLPPALVVVDMVGLFDFPEADVIAPAALRAARNIHTLRERFNDPGWPVVFPNVNFARWQSDFRELVAMASATPGPAGRIAALLQPLPDDHFVLKPKHSAFLATALPVLLAKLGVRRILLAGMALESCVLATAIDANAREYDVAVLRDGVAGRPRLRASTFKVLEGAGIARTIETRNAVAWGARGTQ